MNFTVTILGSGAALPTKNRVPSSQYINCNNRHFLIDCAEGTQLQLRKYKIHFQKISHVFISHLHGDHYFGLVGLLSSFNLLGRENPIHIFGPSDLENILLNQLTAGGSSLSFELHFYPLTYEEKVKIHEDDVVEVYSFPLKHKIPTCGFLIREKPKPLKINKKEAEKRAIKMEQYKELQKGQDIVLENGEICLNKELTLDPLPLMSYAYCSDTMKFGKVPDFIKGSTVLYHEATFLKKEKDRARKTLHSTTEDAAEIAIAAGVKKLYVGHISSRYSSDEAHTYELQHIFKNAEVVHDGLVIDLSKIR